MYYKKKKTNVDAIQFTLNNDKKVQPIEIPQAQAKEAPVVAAQVEMTADEYKAMIEMAKSSATDDCEMCGS